MTGRGYINNSKKRHCSNPLASEAKDARAENDDNLLGAEHQYIPPELPTWSQVTERGGGRGGKSFATTNRFGLLAQANSYPDKTMRSSSVSSRGSRRGSRIGHETLMVNDPEAHGQAQAHSQAQSQELAYSESSLGAASRFVTPEPDGAYRDDIAIEFQQLNGKPFKGTITVKEARDVIFKEILGFNPRLLHSIRPVFGGVVTIRFKLKEQIFLDSLASVEYFDLTRVISSTRTDVISCRIMGIRGLQAAPNYDGTSNDVRWIKVENCEYAVSDEKIMQWLKLYGEPLSLIGEDMLPDSDSDAGPLGNGTYSVKMKLVKDIPQFLPMHGRKIRIYFKNMNKLCTNCFGSHSRRQCTNEKVPWIVYVRDFMFDNPDIDESYYGKWWEVIDNEFPGYFDQNPGDQQSSVQTIENGPRQTESSQNNEANKANQAITRTTRSATPRVQADHQRQSRDPRLQKQQYQGQPQQQHQEDGAKVDQLVQKGLTVNEARTYLKNKKDQAILEQRMSNLASNINQQPHRNQGEQNSETIIGPGSSRGGRGGLSFN